MSKCVRTGVRAGLVAGIFGGLPSLVLVPLDDLVKSTRAIAYVVPGNARLRSPLARLALGGAAHFGISVLFATIYACLFKKRPLLYAMGIWLLNLKLLAPKKIKDADKSAAFLDHLAWGAIVGLVVEESQGARNRRDA